METVGYAALQIIPSARGFGPTLGSQVNPGISSVATSAGGRFKTGFLGAIKGIAGPLLATMGVVAVGSFIKGTISAASDLNESINAVNVTFGRSAEGIQQLGEQAASSLGLSQNEFNGLAVRFSNFASTVAKAGGGTVVGVMDDITQRAADFASVMNLDVSDAAELFQSGLAGETEPLRRYGLDLSAAKVEAYALSAGIADNAATMTEAQKVQARYELLMKGTQKTQGDFANTSSGLANSQRILGAEWENLKAKLGSGLLPVLAGFVSFLSQKALPAVSAIFAFFKSGDSIGSGLAELLNIPGDAPIFQFLADVRQHVMDFVSDLQKGGITKAISGLFGGGGKGGGGMFKGLTDAISSTKETISQLVSGAVDLFQQIRPTVMDVANVFAHDLVPAVIAFWTAIQPIVQFFIRQFIPIAASALKGIYGILKGVIQVLSGVLNFIAGVFTGDWSRAWDGIKQIFSGVWSAIKGILQAALGGILHGLGAAWNVIKGGFGALWGWLKGATGAVWAFIKGIISRFVGGIISYLRTQWNIARAVTSAVWNFIKGLISKVWSGITSFVSGAVQRVVGFITNAWHTAQALTSSAWSAVTNLISSGVSRAIDFVSRLPGRILGFFTGLAGDMKDAAADFIGGFVNGIIEHAGEILSAIKEWVTDKIPDWIKGPLGISSPSKLTFKYGQWIVEGLALGIYDGSHKVEQATKDMAQRALDAAKSVLAKKQELAREVLSFARDIASSIADFGNVASYQPTENAMGITRTTTQGVLGDLHSRLRTAKQFGQQLVRLKRLGLNNSSLQQIIAAGPEAGSQIAGALLQGGLHAIRETNQLERSFERQSRQIGALGAKSQYGMSTSQAKAIAGAKVDVHKGAVVINFDGDPGKAGKRIKHAVHEAFEEILDRLESREGRRD